MGQPELFLPTDRSRPIERDQLSAAGREPTSERLDPTFEALPIGRWRQHPARRSSPALRGQGSRSSLVLATPPTLYAAVIAERLGFDDVIATNAAGFARAHVARIDGANSTASASST